MELRCSPTAVSHWERGTRGVSEERAKRIVTALLAIALRRVVLLQQDPVYLRILGSMPMVGTLFINGASL